MIERWQNKLVIQALLISQIIFSFQSLAQAQSSQAIAGEYIIKMKISDFQGSQKASMKGRNMIGTMGKAVRMMKEMPDMAMMQIKTTDSNQINYLKSHPDVEFVEPNYRLSASPTEVSEMGVPPSGSDSYTQSLAPTQVTEAWAVAKAYNHATAKTIVAVIDSGLATTHGVFADSNSIWKNQAELHGTAGVDDDRNGYIDDIQGWNFVGRNNNVTDDNNHGTHVSGIVIGVGEDILSNPIRESRIQVMPLKFLSASGSGSTADAISAITYAVNNGARIINNSWGGSEYSRSLHEAYTYAYTHNVVIISAAGNDGNNIDSIPMYPAALDTPSNITVASSTSLDRLSSFSNFSSAGIVHVSAPGSSILSAVPGNGCAAPGCFRYMSGTSMASPFVAGLAALVIREAPQLSAYQVRGIIMSSINVKSELAGKVQTSGRVNVLSAVNSAIGNVSTASWTPEYSPAYKVESRSVASETSPSKGGCGLVKEIVKHSSDVVVKESTQEVFKNIALFILMISPLLLAQKLKKPKVQNQQNYRRKYSRFNVSKEMKIKIDDQVVDMVSETISAGGISFTKDVKFETGQRIKVCIDQQEVEGEIVWSKQNQSYGVKFTEVTDVIKKQIEMMTMGLVPT